MGIDWVAMAIAVVAAGAAVWQAAEARVARNAAKRSESKAAEHERAALDAEQRMATASERTASAIETMAARPVPWTLRIDDFDGNHALRNASAHGAYTLSVRPENPAFASVLSFPDWPESPDEPSRWYPDEYRLIGNAADGSMSPAAQAVIVVQWRWDDDDQDELRTWHWRMG